MEKEFSIFGHTINVSPNNIPVNREEFDKEKLSKAIETLKRYKQGKTNLESRIVEEEKWWKLRHWDVMSTQVDKNKCNPVSAWLFNSIINKHADAMDNYPEPNVLPREGRDEADAKTLSSILPVIIERNNFEQTYADAWWYKLKHGVSAYGVFWNNTLEKGLGDVDVKYIDLLNIFWEPGIKNIQESQNLFIVSLVDNEILELTYPELKGKLGGGIIDVKQYVYDDEVDVSNKSAVIDWYYKTKNADGKTVLNYCKFVNDTVIFYTEDKTEYTNGFYEHGEYPIVFDVMFPEEGTPVGFGLIAIMKNPQMYIDKLNQVILENAVMATRTRYFAKGDSGINEEEFLDWNKPIVHVEGSLSEERLRVIEVPQVSGNVLNVMQMKIEELKETSSNRDVSQGGTSSGATAAAAIVALQEAGNKTSRDMIHAAYRAFTKINYLIIELIRQFYDEKRSFRITGAGGKFEFIDYNNANLKSIEKLEPMPGNENLQTEPVTYERRPIFDIVIKPQKRSAYSKLSQNELAKELYQMGFFNPDIAPQALACIDMMDFDGIEKVKEKIQEGNTLKNQINSMQIEMQKMAEALALLTGRNLTPATGENIQQANNMPVAHKTEENGNYLENLIKNSQMDINAADEGVVLN